MNPEDESAGCPKTECENHVIGSDNNES